MFSKLTVGRSGSIDAKVNTVEYNLIRNMYLLNYVSILCVAIIYF